MKKSGDRKKKGNLLETAVEQIQRIILQEDPTVYTASVLIQRNVVRIINGTKYEVDILVTLNKGTNYEALFLFECKNWDARKILPKEVSHFEKLIEVFGATRGFFITKAITDGALNQGNQNLRIKFIMASDDISNIRNDVRMAPQPRQISTKKVTFNVKDMSGLLLSEQNIKASEINALIDDNLEFRKTIQAKLDEEFKLNVTEKSEELPEGLGTFTYDITCTTETNLLETESAHVKSFTMRFWIEYYVYKIRINSKIHLADGNRHSNYEYVDHNNNINKVHVTEVTSIKGKHKIQIKIDGPDSEEAGPGFIFESV